MIELINERDVKEQFYRIKNDVLDIENCIDLLDKNYSEESWVTMMAQFSKYLKRDTAKFADTLDSITTVKETSTV